MPHGAFPDNTEIEYALVTARPVPDERFLARTEKRLFGTRATSRPRIRPALAALGISSLFVVAFLVATLLGGGPFASNGTDGARAKPRCTAVVVTRMERRGEVVQGGDGQPRVYYSLRPVKRTVRRCR